MKPNFRLVGVLDVVGAFTMMLLSAPAIAVQNIQFSDFEEKRQNKCLHSLFSPTAPLRYNIPSVFG